MAYGDTHIPSGDLAPSILCMVVNDHRPVCELDKDHKLEAFVPFQCYI